MSADSRSVHTDALQTLGTIITGIPGVGRDAIHLAVEPVIAARLLQPGTRVGLKRDGTADYRNVKHVGIVDPFLMEPVQAGEQFWLFVLPRTISSLRHVWEHPDFPSAFRQSVQVPQAATCAPGETDLRVERSKRWLDRLGKPYGYSWEEIVNAIRREDRLNTGDDDVDFPNEAYIHYEIITGEILPEDKRNTYFSCAC